MFRVLLVGAGGMGNTHARGYADIADAKLAGVFDTRLEAAEETGKLHDAPAFDDFERALEAVRPDVVDVCCPTPWHADYVVRAAERAAELNIRGIITEKPLARNLQDCDRMISACETAGIPLFVAHVLRFFPEFVMAHNQVLAGAVGVPAAIRTRRGGGMPHAWNDWYGDFKLSGGTILDLVIHDFDWLRWTFGEVERVYGVGLAGSNLPTSDYNLVTLRFKSGAIGHVEATWADPGGFKANFEIVGDNGMLEYNYNQLMHPPVSVALRGSDEMRQAVPIPESPSGVNPYREELAHFIHCLATGAPSLITPQDGREAVRISLAAIESIQTGKPVTL